MKKITLNNYKTDKYYPKIVKAVDVELHAKNFVTPVGVLISMALLAKGDVENWRAGRTAYLEQVVGCNLAKASRILRILRFQAHDLNLKPSMTIYKRKTAGVSDIPIRVVACFVPAAILGPPLEFAARKQGCNILSRADDVMVLPETGLVAGVKANRYIRANRDGTVQFLTEWLKLNREAAAATCDSVVRVYNEDVNVFDKGLRVIVDEAKKNMTLSRDVPYSEVADLAIFREAQRELTIK